MEVIPAIDLLGGQCVRLYQGDFDQVTEYSQDPIVLARSYRDAGLERLHLVDLDGARSGTPGNLDIINEITGSLGTSVQVGGGLRTLDAAQTLLDNGADRAVIGSVAVKEPDKVIGWMDAIGAERLVLAFDVQLNVGDEPVAMTHGWTQSSAQTLWSLTDRFMAAGARDFLCTDIAKDGTLAGPSVNLYRQCTLRYPDARFIASGGVSGIADLAELAATGVAGVVTGKALLDGRLTLKEIQRFLQDA